LQHLGKADFCKRLYLISLWILIYEIFHNNSTLINLYPVELIRKLYLEIG